MGMRAVDPDKGTATGTVMEFAGGASVLDDSKGMCFAWAELFSMALKVHGIQSNICDLAPSAFEDPSKPSADYTISDRWWFVKEQVKNADSSNYDLTVPDKVNRGQGNAQAQNSWQGHTIVEYNGSYYDASYGIKGTSQSDYEDKAIQGYYYKYAEISYILLFQDTGTLVFDRVGGTAAKLTYTNR